MAKWLAGAMVLEENKHLYVYQLEEEVHERHIVIVMKRDLETIGELSAGELFAWQRAIEDYTHLYPDSLVIHRGKDHPGNEVPYFHTHIVVENR